MAKESRTEDSRKSGFAKKARKHEEKDIKRATLLKTKKTNKKRGIYLVRVKE